MSDIVPLDNLTNDDLKKHLASQIALEDWTDECSKCGYPRLLHKDYVLHHNATHGPYLEVWDIHTCYTYPSNPLGQFGKVGFF